eukprot:335872-Rhodomonas_salina.1
MVPEIWLHCGTKVTISAWFWLGTTALMRLPQDSGTPLARVHGLVEILHCSTEMLDHQYDK